jgi:hypothetical protein
MNQGHRRSSSQLSPRFLLACGTALLVVAAVIAFGYPIVSGKEMEPTQVVVLATLLGLSAAAFFAALPIALELRLKALNAGGPVAVFLIVFYVMIAACMPGVLPDPISLYNRARENRRR